jgi:RHS repeat-associated protein
VTNLYQYSPLNQLTNLTWKLNASTIASFYYQLGSTGSRTNLSENVGGASRTYTWQYDALNRLTNENISAIGNLGYLYDGVGNRTNRSSTVSLLPATVNAYSENDWVKTNAYDSNGNTLWATNGGVATGPYFYDVENRLTNFNNSAVKYTYNGDGIRVSKTVGGTTTYFLTDDRNPSGYAQVLEELTYSGTTPTLVCAYAVGLSLLTQHEAGGTVYYFIPDGHGSTRALSDSSGTTQNTFTYDAYGTLIASNAAPQTVYLYCGEQFDPDLGVYYLRARYYKPDTGRFWTMDTIEGILADPPSLHKYHYCQGNPVTDSDPNGEMDIAEVLSVTLNFSRFAATRAFGAYNTYNTVRTTVEAVELAATAATGGSVSMARVGALAVQFVPFGKLMGKISIAGKVTSGAQALLKRIFKISGSSKMLGEVGAAMASQAKGFKSSGFKPLVHGFDDIVEDQAGNLIVVEAKGGTSQLINTIQSGGQMSRTWITDKVALVRASGQTELANRLEAAIQNGALKGMVVTTPTVGAKAFFPDVEIKGWDEIGQLTW